MKQVKNAPFFKYYTDEDIQQMPYTQMVIFSNEHTPHRHAFYEFSVILSGNCIHSVDNNPPVELSTGDLLFVTPENFHQFQLFSTDYVHRDFYVTADKLKQLASVYFNDLYEELPALSPKFLHKLSESQLSTLQEKVSLLNENLYSTTLDMREAIHASLILDLLGIILSTKCGKKNYYPEWLDVLIHRLNNLEFINQPVSEIIKSTGYAHSYVCRFFKKYTGQTLVSYHTNIKVRYSTQLLETSSILQTASLLGWDNPKNYTIAFKKVYHMTPAEYKKRMKKPPSSTPQADRQNDPLLHSI